MHPNTAHVLNNLGWLLWKEGKTNEAEPLYREALDIRRKALPAGHHSTGESVINLALLLESQGKLAEAEPLYREGLGIRRQTLPACRSDDARRRSACGRPEQTPPRLRGCCDSRRVRTLDRADSSNKANHLARNAPDKSRWQS